MRFSFDLRLILATLVAGAALSAQVAPSRVIGPPEPPEQPKPATPQQPGQPGAQQGTQPGTQPATQGQNVPATDAPRLTDSGAFIMPNASLTEMIDLLAKRLKINYIIDPRVKGTVIDLHLRRSQAGRLHAAAGDHPAGQRRDHGEGR